MATKYEEGGSYYAECPNCKGRRKSTILKCDTTIEHDEETYSSEESFHMILRCNGCETTFFGRIDIGTGERLYGVDDFGEPNESFSSKYYPKTMQYERPKWSQWFHMRDKPLDSILKELYECLNSGLLISSAVMMRTAFDRAAEIMGVDPATTFQEKIDWLKANNHISENDKNSLNVLTEGGNAAAHRGWLPAKSDVTVLYGIFINFMTRNFETLKESRELSESIPPKPKRRSSTGS